MPLLKPIRGIRLNRSHPLARGLVGCWLFNEGSGNKVFDLSGNGNTGTFQGTAPSWSAGRFGSSIYLPGTNEYVLLSNNSVQIGTGDLTVVAWVYNNGVGTYRGFISTKNSGAPGTQKGYVLGFYETTGSVIWQVDDGDGGVVSLVYNEVTLSGWHQIVGRFINGKELRIFVDGIYVTLDNTDIPSGDLTSGNTPVIGAWANPTLYFNDKIDHIAVYNRALSASEIALLYREPFCYVERAINPALLFYEAPSGLSIPVAMRTYRNRRIA